MADAALASANSSFSRSFCSLACSFCLALIFFRISGGMAVYKFSSLYPMSLNSSLNLNHKFNISTIELSANNHNYHPARIWDCPRNTTCRWLPSIADRCYQLLTVAVICTFHYHECRMPVAFRQPPAIIGNLRQSP